MDRTILSEKNFKFALFIFLKIRNPKISSNARNNDSGHLELVLGGSDGGHRVDVVVGVADEASHRRLHDAHERVVSLLLA